MKICVVRHGETDWNKIGRIQGREDIPLNETGKKQSREIASYLRETTWSAVITSPLSRAKQTAQIIAEALQLPVFEDEDLVERDYGNISGLTAAEREEKNLDFNNAGAEEWNEVQKRVFGALLKHAEKHTGENIIIVSHGAAINSVLTTLSNREFGTGITKLKNACINMLEYENGKLNIVFYNKSVGAESISAR